MGKLLAEAVPRAGATLAGGIGRDGDLAALARQSDVVIDFTRAEAASRHAAIMRESGTPWVLGTTGLSTDDEAAVDQAARRIPVFTAANFSPGVNLVLALAGQLGKALPAATHDAEILEMHHRQKIDAPSGTALALGHAVAAGRGVALADVMVAGRQGETGARREGEIGFASLRGGQIAGSHTVLFTAAGEQITLTHHAFDRRIFADGAVRAALWLAGKPPGRYAMRDLLEA